MYKSRVLAFALVVAASGGMLCQAEPEAPAKPAPSTASISSLAEYDRLTREWKAVSQEIRALQVQYLTASDIARPALKKAFAQQVAEGEKLREQAGAAAATAMRTGSAADREDVRRFLLLWAAALAMRDDYEPAQETIELLLAGGPMDDETVEFAGRVAFALADADRAEPFLLRSAKAKKITDEGKKDLASIDLLRTNWEREKALRAAEEQADDLPRVLLHTSQGDIILELFENEAPNTVANFISLVERKLYDGTLFHRVLPAFVAQGGDPRGDGTGGPGYQIACELDREDYRRHFRGSLSMAHAGKDTGGSQFFLTFRPTPNLDGKHTVFGRIIDGLPVLAKLQRIDPEKSTGVELDKILEATVIRKRDHEYKPTRLEVFQNRPAPQR